MPGERKNISKAGIKRIMKKKIPPEIRIQGKAIDKTISDLEQKTECYAEKGFELTKHRKGKTITKEDIDLIKKQNYCP